jgi:hypothetical protein
MGTLLISLTRFRNLEIFSLFDRRRVNVLTIFR